MNILGIDTSKLGGQVSKLGNDVFKGGFKNPNLLAASGLAINAASAFLPEQSEYDGDKGYITKTADSIYDSASDAIAAVPGWGTIASLGMKGFGLFNKGMNALGAGTDGMTTTDSLLGSSFGNLFTGGLGYVNGAFGKRSHTLQDGYQLRNTMASVGGAYGGTVADWLNAMQKSNKKYGLFSSGARKRANNQIDTSNNRMGLMTSISNTANTQMDLAANMGDTANRGYQTQLNGGYDFTTRAGRNGMKLEYIKRARRILNSLVEKHQNGGTLKAAEEDDEKYFIPTDWEPVIPRTEVETYFPVDRAWPEIIFEDPVEEVPEFREGGQVNIIPEGALHARKHHMEDADNITKKGIPVVDNEGHQQAEIERDEIIFRKEVTDKIEELAEKGTDEAAIECGKLLTQEIMENTDDKTGLALKVIDKMKHGGALYRQAGGNIPIVTSEQMRASIRRPVFDQSDIAERIKNMKIDETPASMLEKEQAKKKVVNGLASAVINGISEGKKQKQKNQTAAEAAKPRINIGMQNADKYNYVMNQEMRNLAQPYNVNTSPVQAVPMSQNGGKIEDNGTEGN